MLTRKFIVKGRVQGVGYRYYAQRCAQARGLKGYVRNLWDGDVEAVAQGESAQVELFADDLRRGPRSGQVTHVLSEDVEMGPFKDFGIEMW